MTVLLLLPLLLIFAILYIISTKDLGPMNSNLSDIDLLTAYALFIEEEAYDDKNLKDKLKKEFRRNNFLFFFLL